MVTDWTPELTDQMIEVVIGCIDKRSYEYACAKFSETKCKHMPNAQGKWDGDPINNKLWDLAVGAISYERTNLRTHRFGKFSWTEKKILKWAFPTNGVVPKESVIQPTNAIIAYLLFRTINEVTNERNYGLKPLFTINASTNSK